MLKMFNFLRKLREKQFVPKIEEVKNKNVKCLARRLKGRTLEETLTNILDWQERNLMFWHDRWIVFIIFAVFIAFSMGIFLFLEFNNLLTFIISVIILVGLLYSMFNLVIHLISLFAFIIFSLLILSLLTGHVSLQSKMFVFVLSNAVLLGAFLSILIYLLAKYRNIKSRIPNFRINDIFEMTLPIEKILDYRLSVCKDYAKLTSSILLNIYPERKIYFLLILQHVATAIEIKNKMYVLDQRLPIMTLESWVKFWAKRLKKKKLKVTFMRVFKEEEIKTKWIKKETYVLDSKSEEKSKMNINTLLEKLKEELGLKFSCEENSPSTVIPIPLKGEGYLVYENDNIVVFSIVRLLKKRIEDELVGKIKNIQDIKITPKEEDLILEVFLHDRE